MPPEGNVLGFSNRWYLHAVATAVVVELPGLPNDESVTIRLVTAPSFVATKLEAFAGRGEGDYAGSHDVEDIVVLADGRSALVDEVEHEPLEFRTYIAEQLSWHLAHGLEDAVAGHLAGDEASQARLPIVLCAPHRLRRRPRLVTFGRAAQSKKAGRPGGNGPVGMGPWRYEILAFERRSVGVARDQLFVRARITNLGRRDGTVGDGRNMYVEDARGQRVSPSTKLTASELKSRGMPSSHEQALPNQAFDTGWVFELPHEARSPRLLLPFDGYECPFPDER
jgi:hypothetical protein